MLKKTGLPMVAFIAGLAFASVPAKAAVRFGVTIAPPVYSYPAPYVDPYVDPYAYPGYYDYYAAPAPVYPYSYGWGGYGGHYDRDRGEHFRGGDRGFEGRGSSGGHAFQGGGRGFGGGGHRR